MKLKLALGLVVCCLSPLLAGCTTAPGVARGQSPEMVQQMPPGAMPADAACYGDSGVCPECGCDHGCHHHGCHHPKHRYWHHYKHPDNLEHPGQLVYPAANTPSAVVQYPYYTLKGPDDFFKKD